jgi:Cu-processing system ATP-binding protein
MIVIKNISKHFGKLRALDQLSLQLHTGECIALIGPNGCGKTTLIKAVLGMVLPTSGEIFFNGSSITGNNQYRTDIGYMPQIGRYPENMSIGQVIGLIKSIRNNESSFDHDLFEQFELSGMLDKKMRTLSGGTTQKVSATLAFLFRPKVLILDEPTAGLDPVAAEILKAKIKEAKSRGCLVIITSHLLSELEDMVSEVVYMQEGQAILHEKIGRLKMITGQDTVARAIVHLLKNQKNEQDFKVYNTGHLQK